MKPTVALLAGAATCALASQASADPYVREEIPYDEGAAFRYSVKTPPRQRLRAILEELGVLLVGFGEYTLDKSNSADFDLHYDWDSLKSKLFFESVAFDNNKLPTNWVTHPLAGYFYYTVARSNRLSVQESFGYAFVASTLWEVIGEFREQASVNDMIVTPVSSVPIGESLVQLGALMQRSRQTTATRVLGWIFGPMKKVHDAIDGVDPEPAGYDSLGLPADVSHQFKVSWAAGVTKQDHGVRQGDGRVGIASRLVSLPSYGKPGRESTWFSAGEITSLSFRMTSAEGRLTDARFESYVIPAGHWWTDMVSPRDGSLVGESLMVGTKIGFEYGAHDWDRDAAGRGLDRIAMVNAGVTLEHVVARSGLRLTTTADVLGDFAGVDAYARTVYAQRESPVELTSVLQQQGYYHGLGVTVAPAVKLQVSRFESGASIRLDAFQMITSLDRNRPENVPVVDAADRRVAAKAWLGASPSENVRLTVSIERNDRAGRLGDARDQRGETSVFGNADLLF